MQLGIQGDTTRLDEALVLPPNLASSTVYLQVTRVNPSADFKSACLLASLTSPFCLCSLFCSRCCLSVLLSLLPQHVVVWFGGAHASRLTTIQPLCNVLCVNRRVMQSG